VDQNKWEGAVRAYNASVSFADEMIGRLLTALEKGPLAQNTIVVLWTDHGYHLGQKEHWEKFALWEQTTRVPFIIAAPGVSKAGQSCGQAVSLLDIYPTLNELCGLQPLEKLDGESVVPLLQNLELETGRAIVTTHGFKNHAIRSDKWRYIRYADGSEELYDQVNDAQNFHNLAADTEYAAIKTQLSTWLPKSDTERDPVTNTQVRWRDEKQRKTSR
jgi:arylsulfatase A-like enzyme